MAEDLAHYLADSEQVQSALGLGVSFGRDLGVRAAGGFLVQVLPFAEDETIAQVGAVGPSKYGRGWVRELRANGPALAVPTPCAHPAVGSLLRAVGSQHCSGRQRYGDAGAGDGCC